MLAVGRSYRDVIGIEVVDIFAISIVISLNGALEIFNTLHFQFSLEQVGGCGVRYIPDSLKFQLIMEVAITSRVILQILFNFVKDPNSRTHVLLLSVLNSALPAFC